MRQLFPGLGATALALLATACAPEERESDYEPPAVADASTIEARDLETIEDRGQLRLLVPASRVEAIRRADGGGPLHRQVRYAAEFARSLDLEPVLVPVARDSDLIAALAEGRGDVVVANLPRSAASTDEARFTVPLARSRRELVARTDDPIEELGDLDGRTLMVPYGTHLWDVARDLQKQYPGLRVDSLPALDRERNLELVRDGEIELTLAERNQLDHALDTDDSIEPVFPVSDETGIGWAVRADAQALHDRLNRFITQRELVRHERSKRTGDLASIREARTLRVATRNSAANYFVWRGQLLGFEYELAEALAKSLDLRLEIVVADPEESVLDLVHEGRADMAAAFLTPAAPDKPDDIAWSRFYHETHQTIVGRADGEPIDSPADLDGRTVHVRADSHHEQTLERLAEAEDIDVAIERLPRGAAGDRILDAISEGRYDLALVDAHVLANARIWLDDLAAKLDLGPEGSIRHHWALRADNPELRAAVDAFIERAYRGVTYNTLYAKYFEDADRLGALAGRRTDLEHGRQLSPWDETVQRSADKHGFDWRLIVAQMYQESRFDQQARSWVGAQGLMQIMPRTAQQLGVDGDLSDPETSIEAGVRYLDWLRERFEADLSVHDRMWFALAAYNAGVDHVRAARRLADQLGYDRDRWFGHVERAMEKLSQAEYHQRVGSGYVRGDEPVQYVRTIRERYRAYMLWTDDCWPDCGDNPHAESQQVTRGPGNVLGDSGED